MSVDTRGQYQVSFSQLSTLFFEMRSPIELEADGFTSHTPSLGIGHHTDLSYLGRNMTSQQLTYTNHFCPLFPR